MAVLLEGSFTSLYKDRIPDTIAKDLIFVSLKLVNLIK